MEPVRLRRERVAWGLCGRFWAPHIKAFDETEQIDHKRLGDSVPGLF
jgi:hypothetical protein